MSSPKNLNEQVQNSDLVIGAVLIPGMSAPKLVSLETLKSMKSGSVIIDIAIDQGGIFEGVYPTTHTKILQYN